jgi:hypothetical protein
MRDEYLDSRYNHACTLRRISEVAPVTQVGLRSAEREEHDHIREHGFRFHSPREFRAAGPEAIAGMLSDAVYITFDLDAFDSSVVSVGRSQRPSRNRRPHPPHRRLRRHRARAVIGAARQRSGSGEASLPANRPGAAGVK